MRKKLLLISSILALGCAQAQAAVTAYSSQADFLNDLKRPGVTVDFESFSQGDVIPSGSSHMGASITYDLGGANLMVDDFYDTTSPFNYLGTDDIDRDFGLYGGDSFTLDFGQAMHAFGLYIISADDIFDGDFTITTNNGQEAFSLSIVDMPLLDGEAYYLGLIESDDAMGFTSVTFSSVADDYIFNIDDITVSPVPEPSTWLLFGIGLAGVTAMSRRRNRKAQSIHA